MLHRVIGPLGMTFDSRLTWIKHIQTLRAKCQNDLRLLIIISNWKWGGEALTLRNLYISLIRSKLEYGSILFDQASKTNLDMLDRVQYQACRTILGALKCTPTVKLEIEADPMPLKTS